MESVQYELLTDSEVVAARETRVSRTDMPEKAKRVAQKLFQCDGSVNCLALSKDEATLVTCDDSKVVVWDVASGTPKQKMACDEKCLRCLALSKDEATLFARDEKNKVVVWDVASGTRKQTMACAG